MSAIAGMGGISEDLLVQSKSNLGKISNWDFIELLDAMVLLYYYKDSKGFYEGMMNLLEKDFAKEFVIRTMINELSSDTLVNIDSTLFVLMNQYQKHPNRSCLFALITDYKKYGVDRLESCRKCMDNGFWGDSILAKAVYYHTLLDSGRYDNMTIGDLESFRDPMKLLGGSELYLYEYGINLDSKFRYYFLRQDWKSFKKLSKNIVRNPIIDHRIESDEDYYFDYIRILFYDYNSSNEDFYPLYRKHLIRWFR